MNVQEAIRLLRDDGEHKFLLDLVGSPLFIVDKPLNAATKIFMLTHEHLVRTMRSSGIFGQAEVRGGYCRVHNAVLRHWGDSSPPIRGISAEQFNRALQERDVQLISARGELL